MIIDVVGRAEGEDGILIIDDKTSKLLMRSECLPNDVVLKIYLTAIRRKDRLGTLVSGRDGASYDWKVLGDPQPKRQKARRGWRTAVLV